MSIVKSVFTCRLALINTFRFQVGHQAATKRLRGVAQRLYGGNLPPRERTRRNFVLRPRLDRFLVIAVACSFFYWMSAAIIEEKLLTFNAWRPGFVVESFPPVLGAKNVSFFHIPLHFLHIDHANLQSIVPFVGTRPQICSVCHFLFFCRS